MNCVNGIINVLHLAIDEKFIDMALNAFNAQRCLNNELCLYTKGDIKFVKSTPNYSFARIDSILGISKKYLNRFDIIIVHSLNPVFYKSLLNVSARVKVVWIGWGYDYYDLIYKNPNDVLLSSTRRRLYELELGNKTRKKIYMYLRSVVTPSIDRVLEKINYFSPVLPAEYNLVKDAACEKFKAKYVSWNYGSLEDDFVSGLENEWVYGDAVLIGNSAALTNNHIEIFDLLNNISFNNEVIVPFGYGDANNMNSLLPIGYNYFGQKFIPLVNYLDIKDYNKLILRCGYVIMNHVRQQALGNIVALLYLGAKIFLRAECETYKFLLSNGIIVFPVQIIESDPSVLCIKLTPKEARHNRCAIMKLWSRDIMLFKTSALIELLSGKNHNQ